MNIPLGMTSLSIPSSLKVPFALLIFCLFAPSLWLQVSAQSLPSSPVARLISNTSSETPYTRPRRVNELTSDTNRPEASSSVVSSSTLLTETERQAFRSTNEIRERNGVSLLTWDNELTRMARAHSEKMSRLGFFGHETPEGLRLTDRARAAGIRFQVIGENIAYNQGVEEPGEFAVQRWMLSSVHRANILSREFRSVGIGSFVARDGRVFITQIFIAR
jgi:uncharacterized protein YkwD